MYVNVELQLNNCQSWVQSDAKRLNRVARRAYLRHVSAAVPLTSGLGCSCVGYSAK